MREREDDSEETQTRWEFGDDCEMIHVYPELEREERSRSGGKKRRGVLSYSQCYLLEEKTDDSCHTDMFKGI